MCTMHSKAPKTTLAVTEVVGVDVWLEDTVVVAVLEGEVVPVVVDVLVGLVVRETVAVDVTDDVCEVDGVTVPLVVAEEVGVKVSVVLVVVVAVVVGLELMVVDGVVVCDVVPVVVGVVISHSLKVPSKYDPTALFSTSTFSKHRLSSLRYPPNVQLSVFSCASEV